jgi:hypothetical protein
MINGFFNRGGSVDHFRRVRVPYGSTNWHKCQRGTKYTGTQPPLPSSDTALTLVLSTASSIEWKSETGGARNWVIDDDADHFLLCG